MIITIYNINIVMAINFNYLTVNKNKTDMVDAQIQIRKI